MTTAVMSNLKGWFYSSPSLQIDRNIPPSSMKQIRDYLRSCSGTYRIQSLIGSSCLLADDIAQILGTSWSFQRYATLFKGASGSTTIPTAVSLGIGFVQSTYAILQKGPTKESVLDLFQQAMDCSSSALNAVILLTNRATLKPLADVFDALSDAGDLAIASDRVHTLSQVDMGQVSNDVKTAIEEEKKLYQLKWIKAIASFASPVIALLGWVLGVSLLPMTALLALSVASSCFAILSHFYEKNKTFNDEHLLEKLRSATILNF